MMISRTNLQPSLSHDPSHKFRTTFRNTHMLSGITNRKFSPFHIATQFHFYNLCLFVLQCCWWSQLYIFCVCWCVAEFPGGLLSSVCGLVICHMCAGMGTVLFSYSTIVHHEHTDTRGNILGRKAAIYADTMNRPTSEGVGVGHV